MDVNRDKLEWFSKSTPPSRLAGAASTSNTVTELNPYESPKADGPLGRARWLKRGLSITAIVLLTLPAAYLAGFIGCGISRAILAAKPDLFGGDRIAVFDCFTFLPALVALIAMAWWARSAAAREKAMNRQARPHEEVDESPSE
jgi:hypothetical protein